jgi:hypothetical protein
MTTSTAACFWKVEIGRVAVYLENHVAGLIAEYSIRMSGGIVKELDDCFHSGFGSGALFRCEVAKSDEHGGVHCTSVVEKNAHNLHDKKFVEIGKFRCSVWWFSHLDLGAILWDVVFVWGIMFASAIFA